MTYIGYILSLVLEFLKIIKCYSFGAYYNQSNISELAWSHYQLNYLYIVILLLRRIRDAIREAAKMTVIKVIHEKGSNSVDILFCILPFKTIKLLLYTYILTGNIFNIIVNWSKLVFYISPLEKISKKPNHPPLGCGKPQS